MVLLVSGIVAAVATATAFKDNLASWSETYLGFRVPQVEVAWLDATQSPPRVDHPLALDPTNIDVETGLLRLPIQLALRNKEHRALKLTSLELSVGDTIKIRSAARLRLEAGREVRQHEGALLERSSTFLPVSLPDTLILPIQIAHMGWLMLSDKKQPVLFPWLVAARGSRLIDTTTIPVLVTLHFENRPSYSEGMAFRVPPFLDPRWPRGRAIIQPSGSDRRRFRSLAKGDGQDLARWEEVYAPTGDSIQYRRTGLGGVSYQVFSVNHTLRYAIADTNRDGIIDFELIDADGDGLADQRALTRGVSRGVIRWGPEVVRINARKNIGALMYMADRINEMVH